MNNFIPVNEPLLNGNEKKYLSQCIDTGWISSEGPFVQQLETSFSAYCGQKFGMAVANGSVAIDVAIRAMKEVYGWKDGDEVIVPTFTIISCGQSVIYNALKPIFVDCDPRTYNLDVQHLEKKITPRTRAIMVVHIYGLPCDMQPIVRLAEKYGLKIIEDSAQAHGQECLGKKCGGWGDVATFSFYPNKHITTGEGGMVMTSNPDLAKQVNYFKNLCFVAHNRFVHSALGWNFRMSNLQAALGVAQFERLEEFISIKKRMGRLYTQYLEGIPCQLPCKQTPYAENNYWVFPLVIHSQIAMSAKEAMQELATMGVQTRPFFYPLHQQPIFQKMGITDSAARPVSEALYGKGFYIPSGLNLKQEQMERVAVAVRELFKERT